MTFTIFDFIIFTIITISSLLGLYRGFIYITLNFIGFICSIILSILIYPYAKDILSAYIVNEVGLSVVSGASVYIISLIICTLVTLKIIALFDGSSKSIFNRLLGLLIGFVRGLLFAAMIFVVVIFATKDNIEGEDVGILESAVEAPQSPEWLVNSKTVKYLQKVVGYAVSVLPEDIIKSIKLPGAGENKFKDEDAIDAINRRRKNDVKSVIEIQSDDLKNGMNEINP